MSAENDKITGEKIQQIKQQIERAEGQHVVGADLSTHEEKRRVEKLLQIKQQIERANI